MSKLSRRDFIRSTSLASVAACTAGKVLGSNASTASPDTPAGGFQSDWDRVPDRYWTGPDTWANPWEDWQIRDGRLLCIKDDRKKRTVHCLTHQLTDAPAAAEIAVTIEYCGTTTNETGAGLVAQIGKTGQDEARGSAGFELGIRVNDPIDDYRSRLLFGSGLPVGLNGKGELFIGRRDRNTFPELARALVQGDPVRLICKLRPDGDGPEMRIDLSAQRAPGDTPGDFVDIGTVTMRNVPAERLAGNVALVNHFPPKPAGVQSTGLFALSDWTIAGPKVVDRPEQCFGPVLWTLYTLSNRVLKLTAQMPPVGEADSQEVRLQTDTGSGWKTISTATIDPLAATATFRVADWEDSRDTPYRVCWTQKRKDGSSREYTYAGTIRKDPKDKPELVVAGYCCFTDFLFPNVAIAEATRKVDPDVMFFVGDQIYEFVGGFGILREGDLKRMTTNYLRKVALLGWSFRELSKDRPTVWMPDDHDVYHGNLWGAGGRKITLDEWKGPSGFKKFPAYGTRGGYVQPADFVKAVERTQTAHLPDPYDPTPVEQGIGVYYTGMTYGGVSFAILEDRKFKSGPLGLLRHDSGRPDWMTDREAALRTDVPGAVLLGERQLKFLRDWITDWRGACMKMAVSQTIFCNAATHHGRPGAFLVADIDSNGWPQTGRNKAVDILRRGYALMLGGDQHLPTFIQHGIKKYDDAGFSFCVPAGAVGYQRWWQPENIEHMPRDGQRHDDRPNTGKYRDGFGNLIDVHAVANPPAKRTSETRLELGYQKSSGFGVVRCDKKHGTFTVEAWPVGVDPAAPDAATHQYPGWPAAVTVDQCAGSSNPTLPPVDLIDWSDQPLPAVRVLDANGQTVSMARMTGPRFFPRVFDRDGSYTVEVVMPEQNNRVVKRFEKLTPKHSRTLPVFGREAAP